MPEYQLTVGMEVHVELKTKTKMFCACPNDPDASKPNANTCPICMGHPGTLPVPNKKAIESVIKVGLALGCDIAEHSKFDRKNYFYPDLPKGYQISQFDEPLCRNGALVIPSLVYGQRSNVTLRIHRIHLEEDTGKLLHPAGMDYSLVDYNRAGVPLMELVTEPDIHSTSDAAKFCQELQLLLRYLGVSDADMEKGHMRCEANISIAPAANRQLPEKKMGTKVEVKNLNSFKAVERAIAFEVQRHAALLEAGEKIVQETRGWDDAKGETYAQRSKEDAHDYRYFPEPDIPPLSIAQTHADDRNADKRGSSSGIIVDNLRGELPELPQARRERFTHEYGLGADQIEIFVVDRAVGDYFEGVASDLASEHDKGEYAEKDIRNTDGSDDGTSHKFQMNILAANYLINDLPRVLADAEMSIGDLKISAQNFAELIIRIEKGIISSAGAKVVLAEMVRSGADPDEVIRDKNMAQVSDASELDSVIAKIIEANASVAADFKAGKQNALQFLVGQVMKESRGKANPKVVQDILRKKLA